MTWQLTIHSLLLGLAAVISIAVCVIAWRRREKQGSKAFLVLMAAASLWAAGNTLQLLTTDYQLKLLFRTVAFVGHNVVPIALLTFALVFTGRTQWLTRRNLALLAAEPMAVTFLVTPTNALGWHHLLWTSSSLGPADGMVVLERSFGPWYWLNTTYNYALIVVGLSLFLFLAIQSHAAARKQGLALIAGVVPPFLANVAWIVGLSRIDYTPVAFTVTGVVFSVAIYRYRLFDIVPVARETVLDAMDNGYVVLDRDGNVADINDTARRYVAAVEDPMGKPVEAVLPHCLDLVDEYRAAIADGAPDGPVTGEVMLETGTETPRYYDVRITTIRRAQFTGGLVLFQNITGRRTVEKWYRALIENASDLVAVIDEDGHYTYHSPSSARILGYEPEEMVGEPFEDYVHPEDREAVIEKFERSLADPDALPAHEYRFRHADGSWIWLESRGQNLLDHPLIEGIVVNSREITERKKQEAVLRQRNDRLQALASVASHDLRNPLQIISGHIPLARETGDDEHFEAMERAVDRMRTLVDDVVTLAREGELVRDPEAVDLEAVVTAAWEGIETEAASLVVEFEGLIVSGDRSKLQSIFENLFSNAVEHGGPDVTIRVGRIPGGFYIEDDGDGIGAEARSQIFERGFSTESQGSGLGLPIVRSIVTAHGWEVSLAESADGTRFEITGVDATSQADTAGSIPGE
jgi:PAS domain S-box-containing protein